MNAPCAWSQKMDPQLRKLLEVAYEAWMDSGINHVALRGSKQVCCAAPTFQIQVQSNFILSLGPGCD